MKRLLISILLPLFIATSAQAVVWDVLEEYYGSGQGQMSFHDAYDYEDNGYMIETLYDGYAELSPGLLGAYPCKTAIPGFLLGGDVTIEFKVQAVNNTGLEMFFSETNTLATSNWNHITYLNYYEPDTILDTQNPTGNIAPVGFDGSASHTYRFIRENGHSYFYLFDNQTPIFLAELAEGTGAAADGETIMFGIPSNGETYRFYHTRIASVAEVPEPCTLLLFGLGGLVLRRKLRR